MEQIRKRETVLVTGATGFLGEYLVRLLTHEYQVRALGRNREKGKQLEQLGAVFCPGDFTDEKACAPYFEGADYVIHGGALSAVWGQWEDFYKTNVAGTANVAKLCLRCGIRRMVYISSPSIYTEKRDRYHIREESFNKDNELNDYIKSKILAEQEVKRWGRRGLNTVILRPRGLIGIGDTSLVPRLLRANTRIGIPLFNGGRNEVDLTSVENAALACRLALTAERAAGEVFNITNGEPAEFKVLLEQFLKAIGEQPHYRELPFEIMYGTASGLEWIYRTLGIQKEPPLTRYTVCTLGFGQTMDISKARELLGYHPEKTLRETIEEYGAWQREQKASREAAGGPDLVEAVRLYHCGSCTNRLELIFRGRPREKREFPAMAALIEHKKHGKILFDTGYSEKILQGGLCPSLYRLLNPVSLTKDQTISERLKKDGIGTEDIGTILLSHGHPDHIGGLSAFSGYRLISTGEVLSTLRRGRIRDLVFKEFLPPKERVGKWVCLHRPLKEHFLCSYFERVYDIFGDGSVIGVVLEGHSSGQLGIWIPDHRLFLAADSCWGNDLITAAPSMRLAARSIQKNFFRYQLTLSRLCRLKRDYPEIKVVFTHQKGRERNYVR